MNQSETKKIEIPILSKSLKNSIEKEERPLNAEVKHASFIFIMISGVIISLSMLIVIVASINMWRPKLFPEIQTIQLLEEDIQSLKQTIFDLKQDTKNKADLIHEIKSLKEELEKIKTDAHIQIAVINNKLNSLIVDRNHTTVKTIVTDKIPEISQDANVFYAQFLAAIEEEKPLLKFYEHAEKLNLSDAFKEIITNIRKINFEKIKSNTQLLADFDQMQSEILKDTMLRSTAQKDRSNLIKKITNNIQISSNQQPNRVQLKKALIKARKFFVQDDIHSAIDILKPYAHHKDADLWIQHANEKTSRDEAIQNVRNFKGPYYQ
jgi:septal ring factor EnvC (AmiA/AmiB activator)